MSEGVGHILQSHDYTYIADQLYSSRKTLATEERGNQNSDLRVV